MAAAPPVRGEGEKKGRAIAGPAQEIRRVTLFRGHFLNQEASNPETWL